MEYKSFELLNLALIINYNFDKSTNIIVIYSIIFSFYWVREAFSVVIQTF